MIELKDKTDLVDIGKGDEFWHYCANPDCDEDTCAELYTLCGIRLIHFESETSYLLCPECEARCA